MIPCPVCGSEDCQCNEAQPYVCPGCYAVGPERCAAWCIDAEIEREREDDQTYGRYDDEGRDDESHE